MQIKGDTVLSSPRAEVWAALNDYKVLAKCVPGCEVLEPVTDSRYRVVMEMGIAAVKGRYEGEVVISDVEPISAYKMAVRSDGLLGFVNAEGVISLEDAGEKTRVSYLVDAQVGGKVAGVGQRVMGGIAKLLSQRFFSALDKELESSRQEKARG